MCIEEMHSIFELISALVNCSEIRWQIMEEGQDAESLIKDKVSAFQSQFLF